MEAYVLVRESTFSWRMPFRVLRGESSGVESQQIWIMSVGVSGPVRGRPSLEAEIRADALFVGKHIARRT